MFFPWVGELFAVQALEGADAVTPAENNDPRVRCEPLGLPRYNHYDLGVQIFQDDYKIAILYQYDNRWRVIWTDGRPLPKLLDGGVEIDGGYREQRWFGYSVGKWTDDYTLEVHTVGTMSEDRAWLAFGITTVRSPGNTPYEGVEDREALVEDAVRFVTANYEEPCKLTNQSNTASYLR